MKRRIHKWRTVADFPRYEVSHLGAVRNTETGKRVQDSEGVNGYRQIQLSREGKRKSFRLHRLVAQAFIDNPENKPEVNHLDGDKHNNCVDNLEWCTNLENLQHAWDTGLMWKNSGGTNGKAK